MYVFSLNAGVQDVPEYLHHGSAQQAARTVIPETNTVHLGIDVKDMHVFTNHGMSWTSVILIS